MRDSEGATARRLQIAPCDNQHIKTASPIQSLTARPLWAWLAPGTARGGCPRARRALLIPPSWRVNDDPKGLCGGGSAVRVVGVGEYRWGCCSALVCVTTVLSSYSVDIVFDP